jgi:potassium-transporting ATPase KdpC subunit
MLRQLRPACVLLAIFTALTGLAYPLLVTAVGQIMFGEAADGSEIVVDGRVVGSSLLAQAFTGEEWFQPRPSAIGYDAASSGGSNLGPTNPELLAAIAARVDAYRAANRLPEAVPVPVDAVTASGSGLDPHISVRNARLQAARVAEVRAIPLGTVLDLVDSRTEGRTLGVLGQTRVNVVLLNADLVRLEG